MIPLHYLIGRFLKILRKIGYKDNYALHGEILAASHKPGCANALGAKTHIRSRLSAGARPYSAVLISISRSMKRILSTQLDLTLYNL
jgi:hypothetical protein